MDTTTDRSEDAMELETHLELGQCPQNFRHQILKIFEKIGIYFPPGVCASLYRGFVFLSIMGAVKTV